MPFAPSWFAIALTAALIPVAVLVSVSSGTVSATEMGFYGLSLGVPLVRLCSLSARAGRLDVLDPFVVVPLTTGITFGSGPSVLRSEARGGDAELLVEILTLGLMSYLAGVCLFTLWRSAIRTASMPEARESSRPERAAKLTFSAGTIAIAAYWLAAGGIPLLAEDAENARVSALTGAGIPFYLSMMLMTATWWSYAVPAFTRPRRIAMLTIAVVLLASTGWRNTPFALLAVTLLLVHYRRGFSNMALAIGASSIAGGAVALGLYRIVSSNIKGYETFKLASQGRYFDASITYLSSYTATFSRNLVDVVALVPNSLERQHGESLIWNFLALLPGAEREPFDFVLKKAARAGFEGGGLPPTLYGELMINFGTSGVFIGMLFLGALAAYSHRLVKDAPTRVSQLVGVLLTYYLFVAVRGGIGNVLLTCVWLLLTIAFVSRLSRERASAASRNPAQ